MAERIGEVVEATTTGFVAQSYELHQAPALGSFVRVNDGALAIIGVVCYAETAGVDPGRRPVARGRDETDEEEIYRNNPELPELLRTEFTTVVVGYHESGDVFHFLPPRPPRIHAFVHSCDGDEVRYFTEQLDFLHTLINASGPVSSDELIAAALRKASAAREVLLMEGRPFLVKAGKELARLLSNDVNRLNSILRRMRP